MYRPHSIRPQLPRPVHQDRLGHFQSRVRMAQERLPQVVQAVLEVVRESSPVRHVSDAEDVKTVQLVHKRDAERAIVRPEIGEAVPRLWGKERVPVVVRVQREAGVAWFEDEPSGRYVDRELGGEIVGYVGWKDICE